ncbi:MAG: hypothetical protein K6U03_05370 [Firmicutes bacterium]|nr:hypothetical protein [Bacillota bacterium]
MTAYFLLLGLLALMEQHILPAMGLTICLKQKMMRPSPAQLLLGRFFALVVYAPVTYLFYGFSLPFLLILAILVLAPLLLNLGWRSPVRGTYGLVFLLYLLVTPALVVWFFPVVYPAVEALATFGAVQVSTARLVALLTGYLLMLGPGTTFVRAILTWLPKSHSPAGIEMTGSADAAESALGNSEIAEAGKMIGHLERLIILTLTLQAQYAAIGFILTAKSIARFQFVSRGLAEYYLLGTLASSIMALLVGSALRSLWPLL